MFVVYASISFLSLMFKLKFFTVHSIHVTMSLCHVYNHSGHAILLIHINKRNQEN
jgi:hypothetical protein